MKFSTATILAVASAFSIWGDVVSATCPQGTAPHEIDFSVKEDGSTLSSGSWINSGVILPCGMYCAAQRYANDAWNRGMIFNSNCGSCVSPTAPNYLTQCTGEDPDLGVGLGNLLIVSEDRDQGDPDDYWDGGDIRCYFPEPTYVNKITYVDIDQNYAGETKFFSGLPNQGPMIGSAVDLVNVGDITTNNPVCSGGVDVQDMNKAGVTWFQAWSKTSFAIASIEICKPEGSSFGMYFFDRTTCYLIRMSIA